MGTSEDKLKYLKDTKQEIRNAIIFKGQNMPFNLPFRDYADKIKGIKTGVDPSDATALAEDIISPKTAYIAGGKVRGSIMQEYYTDGAQALGTKTITSFPGIKMFSSYNNEIYIGVSGSDIMLFRQGEIIDSNNLMSFGGTTNEIPIKLAVSKGYTDELAKYVVLVTSTSYIDKVHNIYILKIQDDKISQEYSRFTKTHTYASLTGLAFANKVPNVFALIVNNPSGYDYCRPEIYKINSDCTYTVTEGMPQKDLYDTINLEFSPEDDLLACSRASSTQWNEGMIYKVNNYFIQDVLYRVPFCAYCFLGNHKILLNTKNKGVNIYDYEVIGNSLQLTNAKEVRGLYQFPGYSEKRNILCMQMITKDRCIIIDYSKVAEAPSDIHQRTYDMDIIRGYATELSNEIISYGQVSNNNLYSANLKGHKTHEYIIYDTAAVYSLKYKNNLYLNTTKGDAIASDLLQDKIAYANGQKIVGKIPNNEYQRITPLENQEVPIPDGYSKNGVVEAVVPMDLIYNKECNNLAIQILGGEIPITYLDYIESTDTQWIDTGEAQATDITIETEFKLATSRSDYYRAYGAVNNYNFELMANEDTNIITFRTNRNYIEINGSDTTNWHVYKQTYDGKCYIDGVLKGTTEQSSASSEHITLFRGYDRFSKIRMRYLKMYRKDVLIHEFKAAKDLAGKVCMYDTVTEKYYYNVGSDEFIGGAEI